MFEKLQLAALLKKKQNKVNKVIEDLFIRQRGSNELEKACVYALKQEGKRFRPIVV